MSKYKNKHCELCGVVYNPTSPKQKYCIECKDESKKIRNRIYDRKRNRELNGYVEYSRNCKICGVEFKTYYSKKVYCGSEECEKERIRIKNERIHSKRDREELRKKYKLYYKNNIELCRYKKALKYREDNAVDTPYNPRGFGSYDIKFVREYFSKFGYELLSDSYNNNREKLLVKCINGHEWETTFHGFKNANNRCMYCYINNNYTSLPEQKILDYFIDNFPAVRLLHNDRKQISPYELDIYFVDYNVAVEVCGLYWHSEISGNKDKNYHYNKMIMCNKKGIRLITVFEDEINNKFNMVMSRIVNALGLITNKVYARKCNLVEIKVSEANSFFKENHLQGNSVAKMAWGLYYNGELVSACSVGSTGRKHAGGDRVVELKRFCNKINTSVVGGFSKMFNVVKKTFVGYNIKSYCDMRYANVFSTVYENNGFILNGGTKYTPHYIKNGVRFRNISLRKTANERKSGLTEFELRMAQGYDRIWDCGHRTYIYYN